MASSADKLTAIVDLRLNSDGGHAYRLPGAGSRSLLYVFDGKQIGAHAATADGKDLVPGSQHKHVLLAFWTNYARILVSESATFEIWYGDIVGDGVVRSVGWRHGA
jgi:hypothetical protein